MTGDQGPRTRLKLRVGRECVLFTALFQMPEDQGPRTRLNQRVSVVYSIISNAKGPRTKEQGPD
jgi:hypothetical protein